MFFRRLFYLTNQFRTQRRRHRSRRQLRHLDDRLLADIGLDRAAAEREVRKLFWQ